ncbi:MAG: pyridoxamine 5'-phosphate oxidase family protein [Defluviitaleaceae bacterium]|nr:pyridoxamine 5'-phosphate oxidase family protein [Defluviitaleaceae bacterium]
MHQEMIARAAKVIASKANYIGGGMEGTCVLSLIDENGYPTASTLTIAKTDGINWLTFATSPDSNKAMRIQKCNRASVCLSSSEYNITLVGTIEVVTDADFKKSVWLAPMGPNMWSGPDDPHFCVLRFNTEKYNLFFAEDDSEAVGTLADSEKKAALKVTPALGFKGQCNQAIALYEKAFGAKIIEKLHYKDADPKDLQYKEAEKDFVYYSEMVIGNQLIVLGDDSEGILDENSQGRSSAISLLVEFETVDELKAAYNLISDGATILTPMSDTTYSTGYITLVDKFGIHWDLLSGYAG